ncbi:MAG: hypothetical protein QOG87_3233 [Actinomycetota bacterium]
MVPPLRRRIARPRWVALATLTVLLLSGGVAYAYVSAAGSGSGNATTGTMQTVTLSALVGGDAPSSQLRPGGPAADVILRLENPNPFTVQVVSVDGYGTIAADGAHSGCTTTGVTFIAPTNPNITVPAGSSLVALTGAATMSTASLSACQGATFSIPVVLTVHR